MRQAGRRSPAARRCRRADRAGFVRNVAVALGNWGSPEVVPILVGALSDSEPLVRAHAVWALGQIGSLEAVAALEVLEPLERDPLVRGELAVAFVKLRPNVK
jgi:epoxyqueuosine reductase